MRVEIDQSGRIEDLSTDTVIAFANGQSGSVILKVSVKRQLITRLRKSLIPHDQLIPFIFASAIFLLVKNIQKPSILEVDEEYTGKEIVITEALIKLLGEKWRGNIRYKRIGKESKAHVLAWTVHRSKMGRSKVRKISLEEILRCFDRR